MRGGEQYEAERRAWLERKIEEDKEENDTMGRSITNGLGFSREELDGMEERGK